MTTLNVIAPGSGYDAATGIYSSKLSAVALPDDAELGLVDYLFATCAGRAPRDKLAVVDAGYGTQATYQELEERVRESALLLAELGVAKGRQVLIACHNCLELVEILFACLQLGAVVIPVPYPDYLRVAPALENDLLHCNVRDPVLFVTNDAMAYLFRWDNNEKLPNLLFGVKTLIIGARSAMPEIQDSMVRRSEIGPEQFVTWSELRARGPVAKHGEESGRARETVLQDDAAVVVMTPSVVTERTSNGRNEYRDKGAVLTHRNLIAFATIYSGNPLSGSAEDDVYLCCVSLGHLYAIAVLMIAPLMRGATVITWNLDYDAQVGKMLGALLDLQPQLTHVTMLPSTLYEIVANERKLQNIEIRPPYELVDDLSRCDLPPLRQFGCGPAIVPLRTIQGCAQRFPSGGHQFVQGYGLIETTLLGTTFPAGVHYKPEYLGSVGLLSMNFEAKIVNVKAKPSEMSPYFAGELWLRGPGIMAGYLNNSTVNVDARDADGWLHTGDLGYFNKDGYLYIVGRIKEIVNCNGFPVSLDELEEVLWHSPDVVNCAVISYPDERKVEAPLVFIETLTPNLNYNGVSWLEGDQIDYIKERVASFKGLGQAAQVSKFPTLPQGKGLRRAFTSFAQHTKVLHKGPKHLMLEA